MMGIKHIKLVTDVLKKAKEGISKTKIKREAGIDNPTVEEVLYHLVNEKKYDAKVKKKDKIKYYTLK